MSNNKPDSPSCLPLALALIFLQGTWIGALAICGIAGAGIAALAQTTPALAGQQQTTEQADHSFADHSFADHSLADQSLADHSLADRRQSQATVPADIFPLPETGPDTSDPIGTLFRWIEKTASLAPEGESGAEQTAHRCKVTRSIALAADRALSLEPNDGQAMQSHIFKLQALSELAELIERDERGDQGGRGEPQVDRLLDRAIAAARTDKRPGVNAVGMKFFLESSFAKWPGLGEGQKSTILGDVVNYLVTSEIQPHHPQVLMAVADFLDSMGDHQRAAQLLSQVLPHLRKTDNPEMGQHVAVLEGLQRRFNLQGNKIKIEGTLLDGTPVDWASYRGKIVLVDFWATWCGPCRAELPNVLKLYHAYHDKGFDVVGICLDDQLENVEVFLQNERIPWATLFSTEQSQRGWAHPLATYYGITGVPRAILVDRDGTVVDMNARGEQLAQQLRKRLGEPLAKARLHRDAMVRQVSDHSERE